MGEIDQYSSKIDIRIWLRRKNKSISEKNEI